MGLLGRYVFRRALFAFVAAVVTLSAIAWVTQALRKFDLVTAKGQALLVFFGMTMLALPSLVVIVAPFALVLAMLIVLNGLHTDSEYVAMNAAGVSSRQILVPFLALGILVAAIVTWMNLWSGPQALRHLRDLTNIVRADVVANVVQPGRFMDIDDNFMFHIRNRAGDGSLQGLFIYDSRDPAFIFTYTAERGRVAELAGRNMVIMENGTLERTRRIDGSSTFVAFGSYAFDLSDLMKDDSKRAYKFNEMTIGHLLSTPAHDPQRVKNENGFQSEILNRIAAPLYPIAMVFAVFLFLGSPRTTRTGRAGAALTALAVASLIRVVGFGLAGIAGTAVPLETILIVPLLLTLLLGGLVLAGWQPRAPRVFGAVADGLGAAGAWMLARSGFAKGVS